jgi:hypothetical protein
MCKYHFPHKKTNIDGFSGQIISIVLKIKNSIFNHLLKIYLVENHVKN